MKTFLEKEMVVPFPRARSWVATQRSSGSGASWAHWRAVRRSSGRSIEAVDCSSSGDCMGVFRQIRMPAWGDICQLADFSMRCLNSVYSCTLNIAGCGTRAEIAAPLSEIGLLELGG